MALDPTYLDLSGARKALKAIGVDLSERQIKRAAEPDAHGKRKLPFFKDPIEGRLKIEKSLLFQVYSSHQEQAAKDAQLSWLYSPESLIERSQF